MILENSTGSNPRLRSRNAETGLLSFPDWSTTAGKTEPNPPTMNFDKTLNSISVSWDGAGEVQTVLVEVEQPRMKFSAPIEVLSEDNPIVISGLYPNSHYSIRIKSYSSKNEVFTNTEWSKRIEIRTSSERLIGQEVYYGSILLNEDGMYPRDEKKYWEVETYLNDNLLETFNREDFSDLEILSVIPDGNDTYYIIYDVLFSKNVPINYRNIHSLLDPPPMPQGLKIAPKGRAVNTLKIEWDNYALTGRYIIFFDFFHIFYQ